MNIAPVDITDEDTCPFDGGPHSFEAMTSVPGMGGRCEVYLVCEGCDLELGPVGTDSV